MGVRSERGRECGRVWKSENMYVYVYWCIHHHIWYRIINIKICQNRSEPLAPIIIKSWHRNTFRIKCHLWGNSPVTGNNAMGVTRTSVSYLNKCASNESMQSKENNSSSNWNQRPVHIIDCEVIPSGSHEITGWFITRYLSSHIYNCLGELRLHLIK